MAGQCLLFGRFLLDLKKFLEKDLYKIGLKRIRKKQQNVANPTAVILHFGTPGTT